MVKEKLKIMNNLLPIGKPKEVSLAQLRKNLENSKFKNEEIANELAAYAHLACFNIDGREIMHAIDYWYKTGNYNMLSETLRISKIYGNLKAVNQIRKIGFEKNLKDLQFPEFKEWFKSHGIKWFDLYIDNRKNVAFIKENDVEMIKELVKINFSWEIFWEDVLKDVDKDERISLERKQLLIKLANNQEPVVNLTRITDSVDEKFRDYCDINEIDIIQVLQSGVKGVDRRSWVYLVFDNDGIFKVYKELLNNKKERLGNILDNEDEIFEHLPNKEFLPKYYGTISIGNVQFIKQSVHFNQSLADYIKKDNLLTTDQACKVISRIAEQLRWLHEKKVVYLDIKPENIFLGFNDVQLIDFGISMIMQKGKKDLDIFLAEPQYVTPEGGKYLKANFSSDIFQLGILFHQLITGEHPFAIHKSIQDTNREERILKYSWPNIVLPYTSNLSKRFDDKRLTIINRMLEKDPEKRPALEEIINQLKNKKAFHITRKRLDVKNSKEKNSILFPARMGLPHKGHIEYINRLLELGFYTTISIQKSYTITDKDPIPKWIVMKIVAQSLFEMGWSSENFDFILTPFYRTDKEHSMHFTMLPGIEDIIGVASGNPEVHDLLNRFPILDQKSVFGVEGKEHINLSWGEKLRKSVKENDYSSFISLAAIGTEKIISFDQIKSIYGKPNIEFVPGNVNVVLLNNNNNNKTLVQGRVFRYHSPEESLMIHLNRMGIKSKIINPYRRLTETSIDGKKIFLEYISTKFIKGNETIYFKF